MQIVVFVGWVAVPLIGYVVGGMILSRAERKRGRARAPDAEARLAQLRQWRADGRIIARGRMADAVKLSKGIGAISAPGVRPR